MKILLTGNCQTTGIAYFLRRALPSWEIRDLPHLGTFLKHISEEEIAREHEWADLVFFHHKHDGKQDYPTKAPKIPLSVWYQAAPFMAQLTPVYWDGIKAGFEVINDKVIDYVVTKHDFDYEKRWNDCWEKMKQKEDEEGVPEDLRMSWFMENGRKMQLQLTCNHPTSVVFWNWATLIMRFLGVEPAMSREELDSMCLEVLTNPNLAGLPCEESATSGARKHLRLEWGGRDIDDESGRQIARERLK